MVDKVTVVAWSCRLISAGLQFFSIRLLIQFLGIEDYAEFAVISSVSLWMALSDFGFGLTVQNEFAKITSLRDQEKRVFYLEQVRKVVWPLLLLGAPLILAVTYFALSGSMIFANFNAPGFFTALWLSNLIWAVVGILSIAYRIFYGVGKGYWASIYPAVGSSISFLALLCLINLPVGPQNRMVVSVAVVGLPALIVSCIACKQLFLFPSSVYLKSVLTGSWFTLFDRRTVISAAKFFGFTLMVQVILNSDYVVMSLLFESSQIVEYKIVASIFAFVYSFCYASLLTFWPKSSGEIGLGRFVFVRRAIRGNILKSSLFILAFSGLVLLAKAPISELLSGGRVQLSSALICVFAALYLIRIFGDAYAVALASANKTGIFILYLPIQLILSVALQFFLGRYFGVIGISLGVMVSFLLTAFWINLVAFERLASQNRVVGAGV